MEGNSDMRKWRNYLRFFFTQLGEVYLEQTGEWSEERKFVNSKTRKKYTMITQEDLFETELL